MDAGVAFTFWLPWIILLQTLACKSPSVLEAFVEAIEAQEGLGRACWSQRSWRFWFLLPASQPHQHIPPLPEAQDSSYVMGSLTRMGCWSLQDYEPCCLAQKLIPRRCLFTQCSQWAVRKGSPQQLGGGRGPPREKKNHKTSVPQFPLQ